MVVDEWGMGDLTVLNGSGVYDTVREGRIFEAGRVACVKTLKSE